MISFGSERIVRGMKKPAKPSSNEEPPSPSPTRSEKALRLMEEYVNELREIIRRLRQRMQ
jgi:hypothetical protein